MECPNCHADRFKKDGTRPRADLGGVYQKLKCLNCGRTVLGDRVDIDRRKDIDAELKARRQRVEQKSHQREHEVLIKEIETLRSQLSELKVVPDITTHKIDELPPSAGSVSTAVTIWSDWHVEEEVKPDSINGLNKYNLDIAKRRADYLANRAVKFVRMYRNDTTIENMVIALAGDFITGNIHDENLENCLLRPVDAIMFAEDLIASAIEFINAHLKINIKVVGVVGNHPRLTKKIHHATEMGNNLEYYLYHHLAKHFKSANNIEFFISPSPHFYLQAHGLNIRITHGHQVRYMGGVGGLLIPLRKRVAEWDKAIKADMNLFGHFHQEQKFGKIVVNGSMIGYNKYALDKGLEFEDPRQSFFLINGNKRKLSIYSPILL